MSECCVVFVSDWSVGRRDQSAHKVNTDMSDESELHIQARQATIFNQPALALMPASADPNDDERISEIIVAHASDTVDLERVR